MHVLFMIHLIEWLTLTPAGMLCVLLSFNFSTTVQRNEGVISSNHWFIEQELNIYFLVRALAGLGFTSMNV